MKTEDLKLVAFGDGRYLGTVEETDDGNIVVIGVTCGSDPKDAMKDYIMKSNVDELLKVVFRGKGHYSERDLTSDEKIHYDHLVAIFNDVAKKAQKIVENDMFTQALKGQ